MLRGKTLIHHRDCVHHHVQAAKRFWRAKNARDFFRWSLENGQPQAAALGYVPLPPSLVRQIESYWSSHSEARAGVVQRACGLTISRCLAIFDGGLWTASASPTRNISNVQVMQSALALADFFVARMLAFSGAGPQHAVASAATRLRSSGCPSQHSLTRNPISARIPSTFER